MRRVAKRVLGVVILGLSLLFAFNGRLEAQFRFGGAASSVSSGSSASGQSSSAGVVYKPKNEEERRTFMLRAFVENSDEEIIRDIVRMFSLTPEGDLRELRAQLMRYLGLVNLVQDPRKPSELLIQDVFRSPSLDDNFVVYADEGTHVRSTTDPESGIITLRGDNGNLRLRFKEQTITARLVRIDMPRKEVFGEGDVVIRDGNNLIVGEKFYFNSDSQYGVIYNAATFMEPYYYYGKKISKVGEKEYVLDDGWLTTCDADPPHYGFGVGKAWLFQDTRMVAIDVSYLAAEYPIVWVPFFFHPMAGTGFWLGIAKDTRVGWFVQVENVGTMLGLPVEFSFDHYQRLGTAILASKQIKEPNWGLGLKLGLAYDKPLQEKGFEEWSNIVDGNHNPADDIGPYGDWKRQWRWRLEVDPNVRLLHDQNNPAVGSTSLTGKFNMESDPFFKSDFEGIRQRNIDLQKIFRQEEVKLFNKGGPQARNWNFSLNDTRGGSSLTLSGDWAFNPKINTETNINFFANDYYVYHKSSATFPRVNYGLSGKILASSPYANTNIINTSTNLGINKNDPLALDPEAEMRRAVSGNNVNYSISYDARVMFEQLKRYDDKDEELIEQRYTRNLNVNIPLTFSIGSFFSTSMRMGMADYDMWGDTTVESQRLNYVVNTRTDLNESFSMRVGEIFNKGTLTEIGGNLSVSHNAAYKIASEENPNEKYNKLYQHNASASAGVNFFRTTATVSTSVNLEVMLEETRNWGGDRFSPMRFAVSSTPFDFLTVNLAHTYSLKTSESTDNSLGITLRGPEFKLPLIQKVAGFNFSTSWNYDYFNPRADSISINLSFNVQITDLWAISLSMNSLNRDTYLYSKELAAQYGLQSRSFFTDLLNSLSFWSTEKLKDTRFYAQALAFSLVHDLHNWEMRFDTSISQQINDSKRKFSYFDFSFVFSISMKHNIGITFPEQKYRYTADNDGNYHGKYN
ncbi:MAG: hypothetical protein LBC99_05065 [Spirochaetota bacterium]|nr:hypothetical protein [Spirochaetota bacterium]